MNYIKLIIFVFVFIITLGYIFNWESSPFPMHLLIFIPLFIGTVVGSLLGLSPDRASKTPSSDSPNRAGSWRKS
jgi:hypothetical protein